MITTLWAELTSEFIFYLVRGNPTTIVTVLFIIGFYDKK